MQNHNAKIKNSVYRPAWPESVENPGPPGDYFLTNKANFRKAKMNIMSFHTMDYGVFAALGLRKNKANSKPISKFLIPQKEGG
jgi:hypothetical protein